MAEPHSSEWRRATKDGLHRALFHNSVNVVHDPKNAAEGSAALAFGEVGGTFNALEILNTSHLGRQFTLAAMVKSPKKTLMRVFSTYRGTGDPVTGELILDFNPTTGVLRLIVTGQKLQSLPRFVRDGRYHHLAATYDGGTVKLYVDGDDVGGGQVRPGAAHLTPDGSVIEHFGPPGAPSTAGIHLATNLRMGADHRRAKTSQ